MSCKLKPGPVSFVLEPGGSRAFRNPIPRFHTHSNALCTQNPVHPPPYTSLLRSAFNPASPLTSKANPFSSYDLTFAPDGNLSLAIQDKDQFVMLYDTEGAEPSRRWDLEHTEEEREEGEGLTRVEEGDEESFMGLEGGRIGVLV